MTAILIYLLLSYSVYCDNSDVEMLLRSAKEASLRNTYQWKLEIQDANTSMPYYTNGDGPQYKQNDPRFMEATSKEPPHPDIPDEMPKILIEQVDRMSKTLGIPDPDPTDKEELEVTEQIKADMNEEFEKAKNEMRFAETTEKSELTEKRGLRRHYWLAIPWVRAWASSVYTYRWWWWYHSYPARNAMRYHGIWISTGGHKWDDVVTWQGDFNRINRIHHLYILWGYGPGQYSVQSTPDLKVWQEKVGWRRAVSSWLWYNWRRIYWWHRRWYQTFAMWVVFEEQVFAKGFRILMKNPIFWHFGIYYVVANRKQTVMMFKNAAKLEVDMCLTVQNGRPYDGALVVARDCLESISMNDDRELWIYHTNDHITSYRGGHCIESKNGVAERRKARLQMFTCWKSMFYGNNDNREKWILDHEGRIMFSRAPKQCIAITDKELNLNELMNCKATATSTMNDGLHNPKLVFDESEENYWASSPGHTDCAFTIVFSPMNVMKIIISWKFPPKDFDVLIMANGFWRNMAHYKGNAAMEFTLNLGILDIGGIKILMTRHHDSKGLFNGRPVFGISKLVMKSGARPVNLEDCDKEMGLMNRWNIDDVEQIPGPSAMPQFNQDNANLFKSVEGNLIVINNVMKWPALINKMKLKGREITGNLNSIEKELGKLDIKISLFKNEYLKAKGGKADATASIGSNSQKPGISCGIIKRLYKYKKSGYTWVKPLCAKIPLRVYCDYSVGSGVDVAYIGAIEKNKILKSNPSNVKAIRYECAKIGMEPLAIADRKQILTLLGYIIDIGVAIVDKAVIPLGIDYGCERGKCKSRLQSLNNPSSDDITSALKSTIDRENVLNKKFSSGSGRQNDAMGFGLSAKGTMAFRIGGDLPVKGLLCGTNKDDAEFLAGWVKADCDTTVAENPDFDAIYHTKIKVMCPPSCVSLGSRKLYGKGIFRDDSSVCKAGILVGAIDNGGGYLLVGIAPGRASFEGGENNGITSLGYEKAWERSFVVSAYKMDCPLDSFKEEEGAFLQLKSGVKLKRFSNAIKAFKNNEKKVTYYERDTEYVPNNKNGLYMDVVLDQMRDYVRHNETNSTQYFDPEDQVDPFYSMLQVNSTLRISDEAFTGTGAREDESEEEREDDEEESPNKVNSLQAATGKLKSSQASQEEVLKKTLRMLKDTLELLNKLQSLYGPLLSSGDAPAKQVEEISKVELHLLGTQLELMSLLKACQEKYKKLYNRRSFLVKQIFSFKQFDNFVEDYKYDLPVTWQVLDFKSVENGPNSEWSHSTSGLKTHSKAIAQLSPIKSTGVMPASQLTLKYKPIYDGILRVSFLAREAGNFGIIIRQADPFTYYAVEFDAGGEGKPGMKRLRKYLAGDPTDLDVKEDGGYLQSVWFRVVITFKTNHITVQVAEETPQNMKPDADSTIPLVLEAKDPDIPVGYIGFQVHNLPGINFDVISIDVEKCKVIDAPGDDKKGGGKDDKDGKKKGKKEEDKEPPYIPKTCSRFGENFRTEFANLWKPLDPPEIKGDNGRWKYQKNYKGKEMVILQSNEVSSSNPQRPAAILELSSDRICNHGIVEIEFLARGDGYVGILLQYLDQKNYLAVEVYGHKRKQCMLRKVIKGEYHVLEKNIEGCGYVKDVWHTLAIKMSKEKIEIFLAQSGAGLVNIISFQNDEPFVNGGVGLACFETIAAFMNLKMFPLEDADMMPSLFNGGLKKDGSGKGGKDGDGDGSGRGDKFGGMKEMRYSIEMQAFTGDEGNFTSNGTASGEECIKYADPKEQTKYCIERFPNDKSGRKDCTDNFCERCCGNAISETKPIKRFHCIKECKAAQKPEKTELYKQCAESPSPGLSSYEYCHKNFQMEEPRMRCKIDFCNLCCAMGNWVFMVKFDTESINKCHKKCIEVFTDHNDIVIEPGE